MYHGKGHPESIPASSCAASSAMTLLCGRGYHPKRIIAVEVDSVLYVDKDGSAKTAWITVEGSGQNGDALRTVIEVCDGFLA